MTADHAEAEAFGVAIDLGRVLERVVVPSEDAADWLPERLSFLLARENYAQYLLAAREGHDIVAGNLVRALFEEAMRWAWVDEDQSQRRTAFLGETVRRHRQVDEAARELGIEPDNYYGPMVADVLAAAECAMRFPAKIQGQLDWTLGEVDDQLYTQYRLLSQYAHSSLLATASAAEIEKGQLVMGRLPQVARMTILRNAVANIAVICEGCQAGLVFDGATSGTPLARRAWAAASQVADLVLEFAPGTE